MANVIETQKTNKCNENSTQNILRKRMLWSQDPLYGPLATQRVKCSTADFTLCPSPPFPMHPYAPETESFWPKLWDSWNWKRGGEEQGCFLAGPFYWEAPHRVMAGTFSFLDVKMQKGWKGRDHSVHNSSDPPFFTHWTPGPPSSFASDKAKSLSFFRVEGGKR